MRRFVLTVLAAAMLIACGPGKKTQAPKATTRDFPKLDVPVMITEPQERMVWVCNHMWDRFTATDKLYYCDSVTVNGVKLDALESQMGAFATLLRQVPLEEGQKAVAAWYNALDAFQRAFPGSNMLPQMTAVTTHYLYEPNSPVRNEDLYLPFVERLAASDLIDPDYRAGYAWDAQKCALNPTGSVAADFEFIDISGKKRTLHSIKAERLLLIFGNPDCHACKEIMETLENIPPLEDLITSGSLKVVDIYIDEDIELWKSKSATYPSTWINGYDPNYTIRGDMLYNIRAIPSVYLLDAEKRVLLKDTTTEDAVEALLY